jgi:hypothetical protein
LAVFAALGAVVLMWSSGSQVARADIGGVKVDGTTISDGDDVNVAAGDSVSIQVTLASPRPAAVEFTTSSVASGHSTEFNFTSCDDNSGASADDCDVDSGDGSDDLVVTDPTAADPAGLQVVTVSLTVDCDNRDPMQVQIEETTGGAPDTFNFGVICDNATPTATATGTVSAVRTVVVTSANQSLGCANTTIITISVKTSSGTAVPAGTLVNIAASIGAVSPTSGQTTADGSVFVFYTAPQNQGGTATITATSGSSNGTASIVINCNAAPTQAPPPTTAPSTGIQPPNTGDGGLSGDSSWRTYAGIAMIIASVIGTLVVVRPRA